MQISKSVLILGWEFPPRMVGGLAIATYGIVAALSRYMSVHLIIPFKDETTPSLPNVTIYGLNQIEQEFDVPEIQQLLQKNLYLLENQEVYSYPLYDQIKLHNSTEGTTTFTTAKEQTLSYLQVFKSAELYGWSLWSKMQVYEDLVGVLAKFIDFDVVHCHDWVTFNAGKKIKGLYNKPLCVHVHARNDIYEIERSAMDYADRIFPVSNYTKEQITEHYNIDASKIVPIHNAIDAKLIRRWKHKIPQRIVTFLGRITLQKGPQFLFETAKKVIAKYPNIRFVIAGKGDQLMQLVNSAAQAELSRYFIFAGFINRSEVDALFAASDVYFMPSVSEPFGLTALEAARAGVPCVLTKQSGAAEVLPSALTADFWDTDLFAKHLLDLLKDESFRQEKITQASHELQQSNWDNAAVRIANEYSLIL